jgi:UDP-N-acetylmuramoyl-tripeptide--D-alanyl-D-alanine ligase
MRPRGAAGALVKVTAREAAAAWGIAPPADLTFSGVAVDSRRVEPGNLFVALAGARVDGHDFVAEAIRRGAAAALVARVPAGIPEGFPLFVVADPLSALQSLAAKKRADAGFRLAAVTGSVGKTTTKEMAAAIVSRKLRTGKTPGNANSGIGFPMAVLGLPEGLEAVCGEFGMSTKGEISLLSRLFRPDVAAITIVAPVHAENFASVDEIADAKWEITEGLAAGGTLVYNAADPRLAARAGRWIGPAVTFGAARSDVTASEVAASGLSGTEFTLEMRGEKARVRLPIPGLHQVANCLCAAAMALVWGLSPSDVSAAMARFSPPERRGAIFRHASGAEIVDDSYNASPHAMRSAVESLAGSAARGHRIAVLGEMRELGAEGPRWHRELGEFAAARVDRLFCVGALASEIARGAREGGLAAEKVTWLERAEDVAPALAGELRSGDVVWIKGSRGVRLDVAADVLRNAER